MSHRILTSYLADCFIPGLRRMNYGIFHTGFFKYLCPTVHIDVKGIIGQSLKVRVLTSIYIYMYVKPIDLISFKVYAYRIIQNMYVSQICVLNFFDCNKGNYASTFETNIGNFNLYINMHNQQSNYNTVTAYLI